MNFTGSNSQTDILLSFVLEQYVQLFKNLFLIMKLHLWMKESLKRWFYFGSAKYSAIKPTHVSELVTMSHQWVNICVKKTTNTLQSMANHTKMSLTPGACLISQEDLWAGCLTKCWPLPPHRLQELLKQFPSVKVILDTLLGTQNRKIWKNVKL